MSETVEYRKHFTSMYCLGCDKLECIRYGEYPTDKKDFVLLPITDSERNIKIKYDEYDIYKDKKTINIKSNMEIII
jgi:hypothetical protein